MPVRHLLKQIETHRSRREGRRSRPAWINELVSDVADLFEPLTDDGRVGFECRLTEECWVVGVYLGSTEVVGGPDDGTSRYTDFQFDLLPLLELFGEVERFRWSAVAAGDDPGAGRLSTLTVEGRVADARVRLQVYSVPPPDAAPGFREFSDGRREPS